MRVWRLAPKVTVATITVTASTDPRMAERTGTALRPAPGSRANRIPLTAGSGIPAEAAYPAMTEGCAPDGWLARTVTVRGEPAGHEQGRGAEHHHEHQDPESEHRPVRGHPGCGVDRVNRTQGEEQGESEGHAEGQHRRNDQRSDDSHQPVHDDDPAWGPQGTQYGKVVDI